MSLIYQQLKTAIDEMVTADEFDQHLPVGSERAEGPPTYLKWVETSAVSESHDYEGGTYQVSLSRNLSLQVVINLAGNRHQTSQLTEDLMELIGKVEEKIINFTDLLNLVRLIRLDEYSFEYLTEGKKQIAQASMTFVATYLAAQGEPRN